MGFFSDIGSESKHKSVYSSIGAKATPQLKETQKTFYQKNLSKPVQQTEEPWNTRRAMGEIWSLSDTNTAQQKYNMLNQLRTDPNSKYYNAYSQPTNKAYNNLTAYGINVSDLTEDWFNQNNGWLESNLEYRGQTNTPSAPTKKSTDEQRLAYELWQYKKAMEDTQAAKDEIAALREEVAFKATRSDRNYSDDDIINSIDWSKYKKLSAAKANAKANKPTEFNEALYFSDDDIYGWIWSARNGYDGDNNDYAMAMSYLGEGNTWKYNADIAQRLDHNSPNFKPYSVGSVGIDDAALYFNSPTFDKDWTTNNSDLAWSQDETEKKMFNKVLDADTNATNAETESDALKKWMAEKFATETNYEEAVRAFEAAYAAGEIEYGYGLDRQTVKLSTLKKMDASTGYTDSKGNPVIGNGNLIPMTRAVDYKYEDALKAIKQICDQNAGLTTGRDVLSDLEGKPTPEEAKHEAEELAKAEVANSQPATANEVPSNATSEMDIIGEAQSLLRANRAQPLPDYKPNGSEAEGRENLPNMIKLPMDASDKPGMVQLPDKIDSDELRQAYDAKHGEGAFDRDLEAARQAEPEPDLTETLANTIGVSPVLSDEQLRAAYDKKYGEGSYDQATTEVAQPKEKTPDEQAEEEQSRRAYSAYNSLAKWMSKQEVNFNNAFPSTNSNLLIDSFQNAKAGKLTGMVDQSKVTNEEWVIQQATKRATKADKNYQDIKFGSLAFCAEFEKNQQEIDSLQDQLSELKKNYDMNQRKMMALTDVPQMTGIEVGEGFRFFVNAELGEDGKYHISDDQKSSLSNQFIGAIELGNQITFSEVESQIEDQLEKLNARTAEIMEAKKQYPDLTRDDSTIPPEDIMAEIEKLENRLTYCENQKAQNLDKYNEYNDANFHANARRQLMAGLVSEESGVNVDLQATDQIIDFVDSFSFWERPGAEYDSIVGKLHDYYGSEATGGLGDLSEVETHIERLNSDIENARYILDNFDNLPDYYREKMTDAVEYLEQSKRQYEAYMLTQREDFADLVEAGKGIYYNYLIEQQDDPDGTYQDMRTGWQYMTPAEQEIYYAVAALNGIDKADQYYDDIDANLRTRNIEDAEANMKAMASKGLLGRLFCEGFSIGSSLIEVPANVLYLLGSALTGEGNEWLRIPSKIAQKANEAVMSEVHNIYSGTIWDTLFSGFYEIANNRGRSMLIGNVFGPLMPDASGLAGDIIHSFPMASIAFGEGYEEAKEAGMNELQAWTIGLVNFASESVTEGIKFGNFKDAFPDGLSLMSYKEFFMDKLAGLDWLEEACGETMNNIIEREYDKWIAKDTGKHAERIRQYIESGLAKNEDEAEMLAMADYLKEDIHTAMISAVSTFVDVLPFTWGKIKSTYYYANELSDLRRTGDQTTTIKDLRDRDYKAYQSMREAAERNVNVSEETRRGMEATPETEVSAEEEAKGEPAVMPEELEARQAEEEAKKERDKEYEVELVILDEAFGADQTTRSSLIAGALMTDSRNKTQAMAATSALEAEVGENTVHTVQEMLKAGKDGDVSLPKLKLGIQYGVLADGECKRVMASKEYIEADPATAAKMLAAAVEKDARSSAVRGQVDSAIHETRVDMKQQQMLGTKEIADRILAANMKAAEAAQRTADAQKELETRQGIEEEAAKAQKEAAVAAAENPTDENCEAHRQTVDAQKRAAEVTEEYRQSAENAQKEEQATLEEVEQEKKAIREETRKQAEQEVLAEENQEREAAAQAAEEKRIAQEQEAKEAAERQAEADRISGEERRTKAYADIDRLVDGLDATDDKKTQLKKQLKERWDTIDEKGIDTSKRLSDSQAFLALGALQKKLGTPIVFADDAELNGADGKYANGVIYLNSKKASDGSMRIGQALVQVALHEITHSLEQTKHYDKYKKTVLGILYGEGNNFNQDLYDLDIKQKIDLYAKRGTTLTPEQAEQEIIADFAKKRLASKETVQRFMDAGLAGRMRNTLHNINQALKNFTLKGEERTTAEQLRRAERLFQKALVDKAKTEVHPGAEQFSVAQFAQATGMTYDEKKQTLTDAEGRVVDGVNVKVTREMIQKTPVGKLIALGLSDDVCLDENGQPRIGEDGQPMTQKTAALDMFSGLMNMIAMLRDQNMVWEIAGGTLESTFSALKANSDTQYHDTIDFGTICAKTQAIVNVMSEVMMDRLKANQIARKEGRMQDVSYGLTREDVLKIYNETHKAGLSVPCPVCYVFSRWMGVPSLLGQMGRFQHDYIVVGTDENGNDIMYGDADPEMDEDGYAKFDTEATKRKANEYINEMHRRYGDKDGVDERKATITKEIDKKEKRHTKIASEIERLNGIINNPASKKRSVEAAQRNIVKLQEEMVQNARDTTALDEELREVEAYNWITQSLCKQVKVKNAEGKTVTELAKDADGNYEIDEENFRITPDEVLMDMRRTGEFADRYAKNWAYRTSRGAGMGKSILPYSGASLGDILNGKQTRLATEDNPLFQDNDDKITGTIEDARARARRQNLIGGQRLQSTSDFRPEWGLDYIMAFLELQAAQSNAQMYTKVAEAIDMFASAGADVNCSIMGSGDGYHEASAEEIEQAKTDPELASRMGTVNGKTYVLDFSDVTGMKYSDAKAKSKQYDNVQMILVGMNDTHIRLAMANDDIDFIIPWHSSGNSNDVLSQLVASVEETLETSSDYTKVQSDKFVTRKESYTDEEGKKKTRDVDGRTDEQKTLWSARLKILTGLAEKAVDSEHPEKGGLTADEMKAVQNNPFLADLYDRFYKRPGDKCYHVALTAAQAKQIFPYEYWQTDPTKPGGTKETADENGARFIEYCQALGVVPRFSGKYDKKAKSGDSGNFAGAIYNAQGEIVGYDREKMAPGYWKLLIDRKMYGLDGKYREQKTIDTSRINIGGVDETGAISDDSMLPKETSAKYGSPRRVGDPYYELERQAAKASEKVIEKPFDLKEQNQDGQNLFQSEDDLTEAELDDMLRQATADQREAEQRGDMEAAEEDSQFISDMRQTAPEQTEVMTETEETDEDDDTGLPIEQYAYSNPEQENLTEAEMDDMLRQAGTIEGEAKSESPVDSLLSRNGWTTSPGFSGDYDDYTTVDWIVDKDARKIGYRVGNRSIYGSDETANGHAQELIDAGFVWKGNRWVHEGRMQTQNQQAQQQAEQDRGNSYADVEPRNLEQYQAQGEYAPGEGEQAIPEQNAQPQAEVQQAQPQQLVPRTVERGVPIRQWGNNMAQELDELADRAKQAVLNSPYAPDTNAEQIDRAVAWAKSIPIREGQPDRYTAVMQAVTSPRFNFRSADGQARMVVAMGLAIAKNDSDMQVKIANIVNRQGTALGQALQARKLFRIMTPDGRRQLLQKMLDDETVNLQRQGIETDELKFSDWVMQAAGAAQTAKEFEEVRRAAAAELAAQLPVSWKDRLNSFRMLSMLFNPRTHIRNIIGNALFVPAVGLKNKISALAELTQEKGKRTKTLAPFLSKEARTFASEDAEKMESTLRGEGKYNEQRLIKSFQKPLGEVGNFFSELNSNLLEGEDWIFLKGHYRRALGGWMMANGYTAEQLSSNESLLNKGREYAIKEAQKATYRDYNKLASTLNEISRQGGAIGFLTDAVLPFRKTPANILKRGIEYSPIGIIKGLTYDMYHMKQYLDAEKRGRIIPDKAMSPNQVIDDICAGLSGSLVMAMGYLLAGSGAVSCGLDDDEDEFEKLKGNQKYSIRFNLFGEDVTYTMDWAAPMSMPFFVGAALRDSDMDFDLDSIINAFASISEPVFNLSMLDGVNTLFKTSQYDDTTQIVQILAKIGSNYVSSYVPSVIGAITRTFFDDTRRKSFVESGKGTGVAGTLRYAWEQLENKLPGASKTNIPVRNVWGEAETSDFAERLIENFLSPGYINNYEEDPVVNELGRLFDLTGQKSLIPSMPAKKLTYGKTNSLSGNAYEEVLTAERWDDYVVYRGQAAYKELKALMSTSYYKDADEATQIDMISKVWDYANDVAKKSMSSDYKMKDYMGAPVTKIIADDKAKKQDNQIKDYKKSLTKALNTNDANSIPTIVQALKDLGMTDDKIRDAMGDSMREKYKDAYRNRDGAKISEYERMLDATGYSFASLYKSWKNAVDKE